MALTCSSSAECRTSWATPGSVKTRFVETFGATERGKSTHARNNAPITEIVNTAFASATTITRVTPASWIVVQSPNACMTTPTIVSTASSALVAGHARTVSASAIKGSLGRRVRPCFAESTTAATTGLASSVALVSATFISPASTATRPFVSTTVPNKETALIFWTRTRPWLGPSVCARKPLSATTAVCMPTSSTSKKAYKNRRLLRRCLFHTPRFRW
mmetsp:Transcript_5956/g.14729  ORF Transcript_5956/g.14729 Transcript_5956/m.14729 type:complete len:218 (+) Transcript_5956:715-1368(+)